MIGRSSTKRREMRRQGRYIYIPSQAEGQSQREVAGARLVTCWLKKLPGGFTAKEEGGGHPGHSAVKEDTERR